MVEIIDMTVGNINVYFGPFHSKNLDWNNIV